MQYATIAFLQADKWAKKKKMFQFSTVILLLAGWLTQTVPFHIVESIRLKKKMNAIKSGRRRSFHRLCFVLGAFFFREFVFCLCSERILKRRQFSECLPRLENRNENNNEKRKWPLKDICLLIEIANVTWMGSLRVVCVHFRTQRRKRCLQLGASAFARQNDESLRLLMRSPV